MKRFINPPAKAQLKSIKELYKDGKIDQQQLKYILAAALDVLNENEQEGEENLRFKFKESVNTTPVEVIKVVAKLLYDDRVFPHIYMTREEAPGNLSTELELRLPLNFKNLPIASRLTITLIPPDAVLVPLYDTNNKIVNEAICNCTPNIPNTSK